MKLPITLPFDDFYKLTNTMFESNPCLIVFTEYGGNFESKADVEIHNSQFGHMDTTVTITSIGIREPEFTIGDTVMIVDTGEIGEVEKINPAGTINVEGKTRRYLFMKPRELVKIPHDLLHKLQD